MPNPTVGDVILVQNYQLTIDHHLASWDHARVVKVELPYIEVQFVNGGRRGQWTTVKEEDRGKTWKN